MEGYSSATNTILSKAYSWMTIGLILTGVVAFLTTNSPTMLNIIHGNPFMRIVLIIAQVGLVWYLSMNIFNMSASSAVASFLIYSALLGLTLSILAFYYTGQQIAGAFFISAGMFGGASLFGKVTKQDLSSIGHYAIMFIIGIILASVVNAFLRNSALDFIISFVAVVFFTALTAYDTQVIIGWQKSVDVNDSETRNRLAIMGALKLYIDFINIFLHMLNLLNRRN
ncbi:Bax inhibitor-1/YccA family protein [Entomospira entomophila]|uniref:Bax inhibitor-1/YccA family protein n=1 Tax=Entomospira entomophila TaxID=2719988 RepID=A0A968G9H4_9SPIO|nr:Bax inhibitor-1/YccA family protein [Entomospira entomophilus]NIZ41007.1 Bax inhibitor-1/YccA family protein [Entomospira entomophilus]WDI35220.1 Bax inhibitor-1/YccA family protein [Entomospira entomophilus]